MTRRSLLVVALSTPALAFGQRAPLPVPPTIAKGDFAVERIAGLSWYSPGGSLGDVTHRRVYVTGIRRNWYLAASRSLALAYTTEIAPLVVVQRTAPNSRTCWFADSGDRYCRLDRSAQVAVGAGGSPLGAKLYLNRSGRWRAHVGGAGGALLFSSEVPIYDSRHFNFTFEYGGAVELATQSGRDVVVGYKFHHISNGGLAAFNPGLDANVVYLGLSNRRPRKS